jgi:hypothetical protein
MLPPPAVALLEAQLGVIARHQLQRWLTKGQVDNLLRGGRLEPIERGVARLVGSARDPRQCAVAAGLRARPGAVVTGPLVLAHARIDGFRLDHPYEVLFRPGRRRPRLSAPCRPDPEPERRVTLLGEARFATPVDALIDCGRFRDQLGDRTLRLGYDQLRWRGLTGAEHFVRRLSVLSDDPGARAFRDLLGACDPRSESEGERQVGELIGGFRPRPEPQVRVTPTRRVDGYFVGLRFGVEYHGSVDHAPASARDADLRREAELRRENIRIEVVTARDLRDPDHLVARLAASLTMRARELGRPAPVYVG